MSRSHVFVSQGNAGLRYERVSLDGVGRNPQTSLLVAHTGTPDIVHDPQLEMSVVQKRRYSSNDTTDTMTMSVESDVAPASESLARYLASYDQLVNPFHQYLSNHPDSPITDAVNHNMRHNMGFPRGVGGIIVASHVVYSNKSAALFVTRAVADGIDLSRPEWGSAPDIDLGHLLDEEHPSLCDPLSPESLALTAVCLLVPRERLVGFTGMAIGTKTVETKGGYL